MVRRRTIAFGILGVLALVSLPSFLEHVRWFLSGQVHDVVVQGRWDLVIINIAVFLAFLLPLAYRERVGWEKTSMGIYAAFIVSLFVEMYGVPLTIYLTASAALAPAGTPPEALFTLEILGQSLTMTTWKVIGTVIIAIGMALIMIGWVTLFRTDEELVTTGVYRYSRHPQYLGFLLIVAGWFVHWPSVITLVMFPILAYAYYRLTVVEERELMNDVFEDSISYQQYRESTPRFI